MKYDVKDEKKCVKIIDVVVDKERIEESRKRIFKAIKENAEINGFRKGNAPDELIKTHFADKIKEEIIKDVVPSTYSEIMKELNLKIVTDPFLDEIKYNDSGEINYKIKVEVSPEFEVADYKNIKIKEKKLEKITDKDIERELNKIRQYRGKLIDAKKEKVEKGNYAVVDIVAFIDGKAIAELTANNFTINVGSNSVLKEIEEGIIGMKKGEEKDIELTFPSDYFNKNFAGKKALFKINLKEIKEMELPDATDEFVKTLGNYATIDDLKNKIKEELEKNVEADIKNHKIEQITDSLLSQNKFEIPAGLVEQEINNLVNRYLNNLMRQGLTLDKIGETMENLRKSFEKQAEENIRLIYILLKIAEKEKIEVTDENIESEIRKIAADIKQDADSIIKQTKQNGNWETFRIRLLEDRVIDYLLGLAEKSSN